MALRATPASVHVLVGTLCVHRPHCVRHWILWLHGFTLFPGQLIVYRGVSFNLHERCRFSTISLSILAWRELLSVAADSSAKAFHSIVYWRGQNDSGSVLLSLKRLVNCPSPSRSSLLLNLQHQHSGSQTPTFLRQDRARTSASTYRQITRRNSRGDKDIGTR